MTKTAIRCACLSAATALGHCVAGEDLNLAKLMQPVPREAVFQEEGWFVWCGSMVQGNDGKFYLFYSRWPYAHRMAGWISHSQVACAVAEHPLGPYRHHAVVLEGRGAGYFDATTIHNPHIQKFDGKYYLYYLGANAQPSFEATRRTQRIGVAVADSITGPWLRFDQPVLDVTPDSFDSGFVTNPSVARSGNWYIMMYKCLGKDSKVFHGVAFSNSPLGPFVKHDRPIFTHPEHDFPAEDPFLFSYKGKWYTILSDHAVFTGIKQALCLFESEDGINWKLARNALISDRTVEWEDGTRETLADLERPYIWFDEQGEPAILFCAATRGKRSPGNTFNIHIPLKSQAGKIKE